jgi:hypothetical protein
MLRKACTQGLAAIGQEMEDADLGADDQLWVARGLIAAGLDEDGLRLRKRIKQA